MLKLSKAIIIYSAVFLMSVNLAYAEINSKLSGAIAIRIPDDANPVCVNNRDHKITIGLLRYVMEKDGNWFTKDNEASLYINTTIEGETLAGGTQQSASFAKVIDAKVSSMPNGLVSLALERNIVRSFRLTSGENRFFGMLIEVALLKSKSETVTTKILIGMSSTTKNLPLPANPFTTGFQLATDYVNSAVGPLLKDSMRKNEALKSSVDINFYNDCQPGLGGSISTGTFGFIYSYKGQEKDGVVDISKDYCYKPVSEPTFHIKFASSVDDCADVSASDYKTVKNPVLMFYLNAEPISTSGISMMYFAMPPTTGSKKVNAFKPSFGFHQKEIKGDYVLDKKFEKIPPILINAGMNKDAAVKVVAGMNTIEKFKPEDINAWGAAFDASSFLYLQSQKRCEFHGIPLNECFGK